VVRLRISSTIIVPDKPYKQRTPYERQKLRKGFKRRAAIEPKIGHLKQDHRLSRNFYKGIKGDNINVMLAATGMNLKRMLNKWKVNPLAFLAQLFEALLRTSKNQNLLKMSF
jgi:transposase, IS5 family